MEALNPGVPQPGLLPDVTSLMPSFSLKRYSRGLSSPSGAWSWEIRKSFSSEITPATVWTLAVSWVLENRRHRVEVANDAP